MRRVRACTVAAAGALGLALVPALPVAAVDDVDTRAFRNSVTVGGILAHERVFQRIANQNGGTRASGTPGYNVSAGYVARTLKDAGYRIRVQEFTFPFFAIVSPGVVEQVEPTPTEYETETFEYSGSGEVTGAVVPVNLTIPPPDAAGTSPSGCDPADFSPAPAEPTIALIQRGTCTFGVKAANAAAAGYDAAIIMNEGQEGRTDPISNATLGEPASIPVVSVSYADGVVLAELADDGDLVVRVAATTQTDLDAVTTNILATSRTGNPDDTIVVGAHLDSVFDGPGINDNGSGAATILEIAQELAETKAPLRQRVRFAFWGAEENGLLGSTHYVDSLTPAQLGQIKANLNFDMVGSPNYVRFVYDGDGSSGDEVGPPGSGQLEQLFLDYFASQGLATEPTAFNGRSDYGPFIAVGIPAGGLFSGAEGIKTEEQAAVFGGTAGVAYDSCYHQACDTITNLNTQALNELGDGAAHAVYTLARTRTGFFEDGSFRVRPAKRPAAAAGHLAR